MKNNESPNDEEKTDQQKSNGEDTENKTGTQSQLKEEDLTAEELSREQAKNILNAMKEKEKESMKKLILNRSSNEKIKRSKESVRKTLTFVSVLCVLLFLPLSQLLAQHVTLTSDKTELSVQEELRITFTFENIRNAPRRVDLDLHDSFSISGGPYSSSNFSMVNGKTSYKNTVSYDLIPKRTGKILIPAYEFTIKNEMYRTDSFYVHVRKIPDSREADPGVDLPDIFIELHTKKDTVYQGETFTLIYRLYSSKSIVNYTTNPMTTIDGFLVDRFELNKDPSGSKEVIRGREYLAVDIAFLTLTATQTGNLPVPLKIFRISTERSGKSRSFFDDPFSEYHRKGSRWRPRRIR
ncbi:MAG: BatD family protein [Candidatus Marinimicrobia bacterium]|nr:BatD family protein [Candidatus Neomarinimicrobiota bacterium]